MSKEHKKHGKAKPASIEEFVIKMLDRLNSTFEELSGSSSNAHKSKDDAKECDVDLELPSPIGMFTDNKLKELAERGPITRVRKFIILPEDKSEVEHDMKSLLNAKEADVNNGLRTIFAQVHKAKTSGDVAYQMQAIRSIDTLIREADAQTKSALEAARNLVLSGESTQMDAANFRLRNAFASRVDSNTRLAYTSLSTQFGEGYQLCPKSIHQIGKAIPMEISKCRDNCIDCRVTRDGAVTCAYAEWLKKSADNNAMVEARLERVEHGLNVNSLNKIGQPDPIKNWEGQLNEIRTKYPDKPDTSIENTLDNRDKSLFGHHGDVIKRIQDIIESKKENKETREQSLESDRTNEDYDNATLEEMLEDEREPFTEQELDMMIEELMSRARTEE